MVYLLNKNLPPQEPIRKSLQKIFGVGSFIANQICDQLGFQKNYLTKDLNLTQIDQMTRILTQYYTTGSELKRVHEQDLKRFIQIGCYRGFRCVQGLPMRGQRTHTNAKTCRKKPMLFRTSASFSEKQRKTKK